MGHVARATWDVLRGLHGTCCEGYMGHVARAPWDLLRGLHEIYCKGLIRYVARAARALWHDVTCCEGSM